MLEATSWAAIRLSIELAGATTAILLVLGTPLAWWLARGRSARGAWLRTPLRALVALPLVLPPSVLGFYLLVALGPNGLLGQFTQALGWGTLAFTFWGLLLGSLIYSLPFVVQPLINAFEGIGDRPLEAAATLRASPLDAFWHVALPLAKPGYITGAVMGFAHTLGANGPIGQITQSLGWGTLAFTFWGLLIGSLVYSLPFVVQPLINAFEALGERPLEAAATLRAGPLDAFWHVALPLARPGYLTGAVMGFAHTLGEFGVVLMIGGNIPGQTRVISVQIYDHVEALEYTQTHWLAGGMLVFSFGVLLTLHWLQPPTRHRA